MGVPPTCRQKGLTDKKNKYKEMKQLFFTNWHLMRWLRLAFALFLFVQAYTAHPWFFIAFGLFFLFQAIFNLGCGPNGCAITNTKNFKNEQ